MKTNKMRVKKFFCLILTAAMLAGLCACAQTSKLSGDSIYASAKGINTKTVTLKLSGTFPEDAVLASSVPYTGSTEENPEGSPVVSAELKSSKKNYAKYKIKGLAAGGGSVDIEFVKDGAVQAKLTCTLQVDEDLKISSFSMAIDENPEYTAVDLGSGVEARITESGNDHIIYALPGSGNWLIDSCDESILTVDGPDEDSEGMSVFDVYAAGEGETSLVLVYYPSEDDEDITQKKVTINLVSEKMTSDSGEEYLQLTAVDSYAEDYENLISEAELQEKNTQTVVERVKGEDGTYSYEEVTKDVITGFSLPAEAKVTEIENYASNASDSDADTITCELQLEGVDMYYIASKGDSLAAYLKDLKNSDLEVVSEEEFTVSGLTVTYIRLEESATALWEENDALSSLTLLTEDASQDKALIKEFITTR